MARFNFEPGQQTIDEFFWWINERHRIFLKRDAGEEKPWTEDWAMQTFKFTNVFRELDRGTVALRVMIQDLDDEIGSDPGLVAWNIIWYRLLNWWRHAKDPGWCLEPSALYVALKRKERNHEKLFTAAHMTVGKAGISKLDLNLRTFEEVWGVREKVVEVCQTTNNLMEVWKFLQKFMCIGPFISYEIVSDFRWYEPLLANANDIMFWANLGPGCHRGLRRLGLPENMRSLLMLHEMAKEKLDFHMKPHHPTWCKEQGFGVEYPPFEIREIEHSLCEFDKWCRATTGQGRPREKFAGR